MITISKHKKQNKTGKKAFVETPSRSIKVRSSVHFADRQLRFVRDRIFTKKKKKKEKLNVEYKFLSLPVWTAASFIKTKQATFFISIRSNRFYQFSFLQLQPSKVSYSIRDNTPGLYTTALFHKQKETRRFDANKLNFPPFIVCENNKWTSFGGGGANGIIVEAVSYYELVPQHVSGLAAAAVMRSRAKNLYSGKADCKCHPIVSLRTLPTNDALLGRKEKNAWYIEKWRKNVVANLLVNTIQAG